MVYISMLFCLAKLLLVSGGAWLLEVFVNAPAFQSRHLGRRHDAGKIRKCVRRFAEVCGNKQCCGGWVIKELSSSYN